MLDMLAGSASGLLQRDFALGAQLAQSPSIHSPAVFGWGFAHRLDRTTRGPAWRRFPVSEEGAAGCYPGSAALLPWDGWIVGRSSCGLRPKYEVLCGLPPFPSHSHSHSHPHPNPIPLHCGAHGGAAVSITLPAPVVRIAEKSCDRTLSGRIDAVLPWWPRSCRAASNGLSLGKCDPGPKFLGGGADFKKLPTQHTSRQELLHALQPDYNSLLTSIRVMNHPDAFQQPYSPLRQHVMPLGSAAAFVLDQGARACSFVPISNRRVGLPCLEIHTTRKRCPPPPSTNPDRFRHLERYDGYL